MQFPLPVGEKPDEEYMKATSEALTVYAKMQSDSDKIRILMEKGSTFVEAMKKVYGVEPKEPSKEDIERFQKAFESKQNRE